MTSDRPERVAGSRVRARPLWLAPLLVSLVALGCEAEPAGPGNPYHALTPAVSDGTKIAFVRESGGAGSIHAMNPDGTNPILLTGEPNLVRGLDWLPDGSGLVFHSRRDVPAGIYRMDHDGSNVERVSPFGMQGNYPSASPDGTRVAFGHFDGQYDVYVIDLGDDPGVPSTLNQLTFDPAHDLYPAWSPDSKKIAFASDRNGDFDIFVMNADGSGQIPLTSSPEIDALPVWSPDGRIGFTRFTSASVSEMWVMDADGGNPTPLSDGYAAPERVILDDWSPDGYGSRILFESDRDGDYDLYTMDEAGGVTASLQQLTTDPAPEGYGAWGLEFTAQAAIAGLESSIESLVEDGALAEEDAAPILTGLATASGLLGGDDSGPAGLAAATASPSRGNAVAAIHVLESVANRIRALARSGRLDPAIAEELLDDVRTAIELIEGGL